MPWLPFRDDEPLALSDEAKARERHAARRPAPLDRTLATDPIPPMPSLTARTLQRTHVEVPVNYGAKDRPTVLRRAEARDHRITTPDPRLLRACETIHHSTVARLGQVAEVGFVDSEAIRLGIIDGVTAAQLDLTADDDEAAERIEATAPVSPMAAGHVACVARAFKARRVGEQMAQELAEVAVQALREEGRL